MWHSLTVLPCLIVHFPFSQEHGYYEENHRVHSDQKYNIRFVLTFHSYKCVFHIMGAYKIRDRIELVWTEKYLLCMSKERCWQTCFFNSIWKISKRSQLFDMCRKFCWSSSIVLEYQQKAEKERVQREQISSMFMGKLEESPCDAQNIFIADYFKRSIERVNSTCFSYVILFERWIL